MKQKYVWVAYVQYRLDDPMIHVFQSKVKARKYVIDLMKEFLKEDSWEDEDIANEVTYFKQRDYFYLEEYTAFIKKCSYETESP